MTNNDNNPTSTTNLLGIHALVWVGGWSHDECREAISKTAKAGYHVIEIPAMDPATIDTSYTRAMLNEFGLKATVSLGLSFDADVNSEDPVIVERGKEKLLPSLDVVEKIGGDYIGGVVYSALGKYDMPSTIIARDNAVASLKSLAKVARGKGITIGLEPLNRYESNLINTAQQALEMISDIGEPNVVVHLDVYHMNIEEQDMASPVLACGEKLGYVHIGVSHRGPLGSGNIDFDSFFGALAKVGYKGVITFESFSSAVVHPELSRALAIWRNLWTDSESMAKDARRYIEGKLSKFVAS